MRLQMTDCDNVFFSQTPSRQFGLGTHSGSVPVGAVLVPDVHGRVEAAAAEQAAAQERTQQRDYIKMAAAARKRISAQREGEQRRTLAHTELRRRCSKARSELAIAGVRVGTSRKSLAHATERRVAAEAVVREAKEAEKNVRVLSNTHCTRRATGLFR